jgi:hypothetical protein
MSMNHLKTPIMRYAAPAESWDDPAPQDREAAELIQAHIAAYIAPVDYILRETAGSQVRVDLLHVPPDGEDRPYHTFVTSGMSDSPMAAPKSMGQFRYAELMLCLPEDWLLSLEELAHETNYWPLRWLKILAQFPHKFKTWVWHSHIMPNGDPPAPFASDTKLSSVVLSLPVTVDEDFVTLPVRENKVIYFFSLLPLYKEEMEYKIRSGWESLARRLDRAEISEIVDKNRRSTCPRWSLGR